MNKNIFVRICAVFCMVFCIFFIPNVLAEDTDAVVEDTTAQNTENNGEKIGVTDESEEGNMSTIHKVSVVITKVDENGNPLAGATLQILDSEGNVLEEWISDGNAHNTMLPEGEYILHEKTAPIGYETAADKTFTVEILVNNKISTDLLTEKFNC